MQSFWVKWAEQWLTLRMRAQVCVCVWLSDRCTEVNSAETRRPWTADWYIKWRYAMYKTFPCQPAIRDPFNIQSMYDIKHSLVAGAGTSTLPPSLSPHVIVSPAEVPCGATDWLVYSWEAAVRACVPVSCKLFSTAGNRNRSVAAAAK